MKYYNFARAGIKYNALSSSPCGMLSLDVHNSPSETMFTIHCLKWLPVSDEVCVLAVVMSFKQPIFVVCHPFAHFPRHFAVVTNFYWYDAPKILIVDIQFMVSICFWKNCLIVVFTLQYAHSCNTFIIHTCCLILPAPDFRDSPLILWLPWVPHLAAIIQLWFRAWGFGIKVRKWPVIIQYF